MPELPEVQTFKEFFDSTSMDKKILEVEVSDDKIIRNMDGQEFSDRLQGRTFVDSYRRGKYLFGRMDNGHYLQLHFGMTGDLNYYSEPEDRSRHERFHLRFDNGFSLGFDCPRKFARICYLDDLEKWISDLGLGPDALEIDAETFLGKMENRNTSIKAFLLNQKYLAGLGNLYADEICYQTRIHPGSRVSAIPLADRKAIYEAMRTILQKAIDRKAYYKDYPAEWFWNWRKEGALSPKGQEIERTTIAGRTTFYFPNYQRFFK